jgi:hypothetical protein
MPRFRGRHMAATLSFAVVAIVYFAPRAEQRAAVGDPRSGLARHKRVALGGCRWNDQR